MRTPILLAILFAAVPLLAQEAQPAAPVVCPDGACLARPIERPAVCPAAPGCPDGACVARPLPPRHHHPEPRHWRRSQRPAKDGQAAPQPLTPAQRAARLRVRAAQLEQMAADIEAGKEPAPPQRVRRPRPGGQRLGVPPPKPAAPAEASIPATPAPTPEPAPAPAPDITPAPEA